MKKVFFGGTSDSSDLRNAVIRCEADRVRAYRPRLLDLRKSACFGPLQTGELERFLKQYGNVATTSPVSEKAAAAGPASCVDKWVAAHRKQVGEEAPISAGRLQEWEEWCKQGKLPA